MAQEQAGALYAVGMLDYGALKGRLTIANAALVAAGTAVAAMAGDSLAWPFLYMKDTLLRILSASLLQW